MRTRIIGLGNILRGDDGLGIYVVKILKELKVLQNIVDIVECYSSLCVLNSMQDVDKLVIVDSIIKGNEPGTLYYFRLHAFDNVLYSDQKVKISLHDLTLEDILLLYKYIDAMPKEIIILGCEPYDLTFRVGLTDNVRRCLGEIINLILREIGVCKYINSEDIEKVLSAIK